MLYLSLLSDSGSTTGVLHTLLERTKQIQPVIISRTTPTNAVRSGNKNVTLPEGPPLFFKTQESNWPRLLPFLCKASSPNFKSSPNSGNSQQSHGMNFQNHKFMTMNRKRPWWKTHINVNAPDEIRYCNSRITYAVHRLFFVRSVFKVTLGRGRCCTVSARHIWLPPCVTVLLYIPSNWWLRNWSSD